MSDVSAILSLPYLLPSQAQKHVTHNEALRLLDLAVQLSVTARDLSAPPTAPAEGDRYIVATGASGDWAGQKDMIAIYAGGEGWLFTQPLEGWRAYVLSEGAMVVFDGTIWAGLSVGGGMPDLDNLDGIGINTTADATNKLAVTAPATLLSHEGQGHQLKINKASIADTASLLFQTNWSGRAEMGTAGSDAFDIKVSADGATWFTALSADPSTGVLTAAQGLDLGGALTGTAVQADALDDTAGRVLTTGAFGMGAQMPDCPGGDLDLASDGAYCKFDETALNKPGPSNATGMVRTMRWSGNARVQTAHLIFPGSHKNRAYRRIMSAGVWRGWEETYAQNNVLDPVSLDAGVPTGGLIEEGSTATGRYTRLADGTQICTFVAPGQACTGTFGALFRATPVSWSFPVAFDSAPVVTGHVAGGDSWVITSGATTTAADYARTSALSDATSQPVMLLAVGRWA